jgi:hypothetical protein
MLERYGNVWQMHERCVGMMSIVIVVVVDGVRWEWPSYGEIVGGGVVWVWRDGEDETEGVLSVEVEPIEAFLADEAEGLVEGEGGDVVELGFEDDLGVGSEIAGRGRGETDLCDAVALHDVDRAAHEGARWGCETRSGRGGTGSPTPRLRQFLLTLSMAM